MKQTSESLAQEKLIKYSKGIYKKLYKNVVYINNAHTIGEIDLMGVTSEGKYDIYEIKSRENVNSIKKARNQLARCRKYFDIQNTHLYISESDKLELIE